MASAATIYILITVLELQLWVFMRCSHREPDLNLISPGPVFCVTSVVANIVLTLPMKPKYWKRMVPASNPSWFLSERHVGVCHKPWIKEVEAEFPSICCLD